MKQTSLKLIGFVLLTSWASLARADLYCALNDRTPTELTEAARKMYKSAQIDEMGTNKIQVTITDYYGESDDQVIQGTWSDTNKTSVVVSGIKLGTYTSIQGDVIVFQDEKGGLHVTVPELKPAEKGHTSFYTCETL